MNDSNSAEDNKITPDRKKYFPHLRLSLLRCRLGFLVSIAARGRSWCAWGPTTPSRCGWWICLSLGRSRFSSGSGCRSFVGSFGGFGEGGSCFLQYRHHIRFRGRLKSRPKISHSCKSNTFLEAFVLSVQIPTEIGNASGNLPFAPTSNRWKWHWLGFITFSVVKNEKWE